MGGASAKGWGPVNRGEWRVEGTMIRRHAVNTANDESNVQAFPLLPAPPPPESSVVNSSVSYAAKTDDTAPNFLYPHVHHITPTRSLASYATEATYCCGKRPTA